MWSYDGWTGWFWMVAMMLLFWGGLIIVAVLLLRGRGGGQADRQAPRGPSAAEILDERFARGEIDREEYEERRNALRHSG